MIKSLIITLFIFMLFCPNELLTNSFLSPPNNIFQYFNEANVARQELKEFVKINIIIGKLTHIMFGRKDNFWEVNAFGKGYEDLLMNIERLLQCDDAIIIAVTRNTAYEFHKAFFIELLELQTDVSIYSQQLRIACPFGGQIIPEWEQPQYSWYKQNKTLPLSVITRFLIELDKNVKLKELKRDFNNLRKAIFNLTNKGL